MTKLTKTGISLCILLAIGSKNVAIANEYKYQKSQIGDIPDIPGILQFVPSGKWKLGLQQYFNIAASPSTSKNYGIDDYNENYLQVDPTFKAAAARFYARLYVLDSIWKVHSSNIKSKLKNGRASLDDQATSETLVKPGWIWDLVLKDAATLGAHRENLALQILSICGHDDYSEALKPFNPLRVSEAELIRKEVESIISIPLNKTEIDLKPITTQNYGCPDRNSVMYWPKSLGEDFDISPALKIKIATLQSPVKGPGVLPAKYYHVYASAFMGCILRRHGWPAFLVSEFQSRVADQYRIRSLCRNTVIGMIQPWTKLPNSDDRDVVQTILQRALEMTGTENPCNKVGFFPKVEPWLKVATKMPLSSSDLSQSQIESGKNKIQTWLVDMEWTRAAFEVGSNFANEYCSKEDHPYQYSSKLFGN